MKTLTASISDASIKRAQKDSNVHQMKAHGLPLLLRFHKCREKGTWYIRQKQQFHRVGLHPAINSKTMLKNLPELLAKLQIDEKKNSTIDQFITCDQLLRWYLKRALKDQSLSESRKGSIKTTINKHLLERIGAVKIKALSSAVIDKKLLWPLQQKYSISTIRLIFSVLKLAFKTATKIKLIKNNPISDKFFTDFISKAIQPKECKLRWQRLPKLLSDVSNTKEMQDKVLILMMLFFGTRLGETRMAKWEDISRDHWLIPAKNTKTKQEHRLPLTEEAKALIFGYKFLLYKKGYRGAWVFPTPSRSGKCFGKTLATYRVKRVSKGDWTAHDLRKLARTVWADLGVDYMIAEMLLNHALSKLDKTYIHTHVEHKKLDALKIYHAHLVNSDLTGELLDDFIIG